MCNTLSQTISRYSLINFSYWLQNYIMSKHLGMRKGRIKPSLLLRTGLTMSCLSSSKKCFKGHVIIVAILLLLFFNVRMNFSFIVFIVGVIFYRIAFYEVMLFKTKKSYLTNNLKLLL